MIRTLHHDHPEAAHLRPGAHSRAVGNNGGDSYSHLVRQIGQLDNLAADIEGISRELFRDRMLRAPFDLQTIHNKVALLLRTIDDRRQGVL